jgi:hypothetical protein
MQNRLRIYSLLSGALALSLFLAACPSDPAAWYPSGKATIVSSYESTDGSVKSCIATLKIENTGLSTINLYSISLSAETDVRVYYKTLSSSLTIIPGKSAYVEAELPYGAATEALKADGVRIVDEFYK